MVICHGFLLYHRRAIVRRLSGTGGGPYSDNLVSQAQGDKV
jgi:hypothetical protein